MNEKIIRKEEIKGKEMLDYYLSILDNTCTDFFNIKKNYKISCLELKKGFKHTDRIIELDIQMLILKLEFAFCLGLKDSVNLFKNPQMPIFMDTNYNETLREKEMISQENYIAAASEKKKLIKELPATFEDIYDNIIKYNSFLDTYIPKMAHYYGFTKANKYLKKEFKNQHKNFDWCYIYKEKLSQYLDLKLD